MSEIIQVIGDVHGKIKEFQKLVEDFPGKSIQIGDIGLGFPGVYLPRNFPERGKFFCGNHDSAEKAKI